jgi:thiamine biosynthesis lipoprotein
MPGTGSHPPERPRSATLVRVEDYYAGRFTAMASPCEVLVDTDERAEAAALLRLAHQEAERIEHKFSRYRRGNIVDRINHSAGQPVPVDAETAQLIDYAAACWEMSQGRFDITSGVLRRAWTFDGSNRVPSPERVHELLQHVGWNRVTWKDATLAMPAGMEIDLGGIGKEYAVDRAALLLAGSAHSAFLVNLGGDLFASGARRADRPWAAGIDDPQHSGDRAVYRIEFARGGLATSGDARRFLRWNGKRLGHILDPRTGWPVEDPPRSVTVLAATCIEAGTLSTLAYLQGAGAGAFLQQQGVQHWVL